MLVSFLTIALFSSVFLMHEPEGAMQGGCPFSALGASLCPPDALSEALHHITAYHSFLSVQMSPSVTAIIVALILASGVLLMSVPPLLKPLTIPGQFYHPPPVSSPSRKITHWLSLFENSPSQI